MTGAAGPSVPDAWPGPPSTPGTSTTARHAHDHAPLHHPNRLPRCRIPGPAPRPRARDGGGRPGVGPHHSARRRRLLLDLGRAVGHDFEVDPSGPRSVRSTGRRHRLPPASSPSGRHRRPVSRTQTLTWPARSGGLDGRGHERGRSAGCRRRRRRQDELLLPIGVGISAFASSARPAVPSSSSPASAVGGPGVAPARPSRWIASQSTRHSAGATDGPLHRGPVGRRSWLVRPRSACRP